MYVEIMLDVVFPYKLSCRVLIKLEVPDRTWLQ